MNYYCFPTSLILVTKVNSETNMEKLTRNYFYMLQS